LSIHDISYTTPNYKITILMWTLTKGYLHLNLAIFLKLVECMES
jgi:hypothetical protein